MHRSGLLSALQEWERVADAAWPDEALTVFDEATLQNPLAASAALQPVGRCFLARLSADLANAARPLDESEHHDVGGEGG